MDQSKRDRLETWFRYSDDLGLGPYYRDRATIEVQSIATEFSLRIASLKCQPAPAKLAHPVCRRTRFAEQNSISAAAQPRNSPAQPLIQVATGASLFDERIENDSLDLIREAIGDNCTRCKLHKGRTKIVFGVGNPKAELVFVGEGPGHDEDIQGEPFVGRAGKLLTQMIEAMGLRREDVYICNVVKCRPPENRLPEKDEIATCSPFLMRQIAVISQK